MNVHALDTNVLIAWLLDEDPRQSRAALRLFKQTETAGDTLLLTWPVLQQLIWVLRERYDVPRESILSAVASILGIGCIKFEDAEFLEEFIQEAQISHLQLDDLIIGACARARGADSVMTFNRRAGRHPWFDVIV